MKHTLTLAALVFATACFGQVPDYVPTEGLVGWFPCDSSLLDLTGTYTADEVAFDGFVEGAYGNVNGALGFDGESDFVRFNGNPGFEDFSIGLWVKTEFEEHGPIVHVGRDDGTEYNGFSLGIGGGSMNTPGNYLKAHFSGVGYFDVSSSVPYESWQHVCVTWGSQVMTFYVQGELVGTVSTASTFFTPSSKLYFAAFSETIYEKYGGAIDQIGLWNRVLSPAEVSQLFAWNTPVGCTEQLACNFDPDAALDDGSCHFNCHFCDDGTVWDEDVFKCVVANPSDTNFDGCVSMTDLLDLLTVFGTCNEVPWLCGDPLEYQGYDYETVQIGEQCWFAENLRCVEYQNGDGLDMEVETATWLSSSNGSTGVYGFGSIECDDGFAPLACDHSWSLEVYGRLYDWAAVADNRGVCPNGWHVSSDVDWQQLELQLGIDEDDLDQCWYRGTNAISDQLKCSESWPSGNNITGFSAKPAGRREATENNDLGYWSAGSITNWWVTGSEEKSNRAVHRSTQGVYRGCGSTPNYKSMFSIRCVRDTE